MRLILTLLALAATAASAQAGGNVQVSFVQSSSYSDVRDSARRTEDTLAALQRHFEAMGAQYLATGQTLKVEVLDVDLAGEVRHGMRANDIRVLRGRADWPRLQLRYTLESPGAAAKRGAATLADPAYLERSLPLPSNDALPYERRMLEDWFKAEFGAASR
jgi:hypothetical protein